MADLVAVPGWYLLGLALVLAGIGWLVLVLMSRAPQLGFARPGSSNEVDRSRRTVTWLPWRRSGGGPSNDAGSDSLTGLGPRSALAGRSERLFAEAGRTGRPVALLLFDLDRFKSINDTLGHHAGDTVLQEIGVRTRAFLRPGEEAVRLGGDEFAVLIGPLPDTDALAQRAEELLATLSQPVRIDDLRVSIGISLGAAVLGLDGRDIDELMRAADQAMYAAKSSGAGQWRRSAGRPSDQDVRRVAQELRDAIENDELVVHYQPQVAAWSGEVTGFEGLVRWQHPRLGLLLPDQFVPLAERIGVATQILLFTLERAATDRQRLGEVASGCTVSVNVPARSMLGGGLLLDLERVLARRGVSPQHLVVEVAEPPSHPTPDLLDLFQGLQHLGCRVSVHGFGTAHTSLVGLWKYSAIREVKIDPAIIHGLADDPHMERLVRAIINGAHGLDVQVAAEGVESRTVAERLRSFGCDGLQGDWVGPPMPLGELERWIEAWPRLRADRLGIRTHR